MFAEDEWAFGLSENIFHPIKTFEEYLYILLVSILSCCKADLRRLRQLGKLEENETGLPCTRRY